MMVLLCFLRKVIPLFSCKVTLHTPVSCVLATKTNQHLIYTNLSTTHTLFYPRGSNPKVERSRLTGYVKSLPSPVEKSESKELDADDVPKEEEELHKPVMLEEVMDFLAPSDKQIFLDMTFGAGGHTKVILGRNPTTEVYALDRDPLAHKLAQSLADSYRSRLHPLLGRFSEVESLLKEEGIGHNFFDGVLIDAGCSSMQFDDPERGFALSQDGPLDMRMDGQRIPSNPSAADIVNHVDAETLARIIKAYGEERHAKRVAAMIVDYRENHKQIETTGELASVVSFAFTHRESSASKDRLGRRFHVATRTFQALRIFVNDELNELHAGLHVVRPYLKEGGRLAVMTFHSLEDRIVKRFLQGRDVNEKGKSLREKRRQSDWTSDESERKTPDWEIVDEKVLYASDFEVTVNPRSRSAKLRVAYKL